MTNSFNYIIISSILFLSCTKELKIEGFETTKWKNDYMGCMNTRKEMVPILLANKEQLKTFNDDAISALLGAPERNRQFARGKKNYIYFIEPGKQCENSPSSIEGKKLVIEFDALGYPRIIRESQLDY